MRAAYQIVKSLRESSFRSNGSGIDSEYFRLSDDVGVKSSWSPQTAYMAYSCQLDLAKIGMAPECWGFSVGEIEGYEIGAYFTENIIVVRNICYGSDERGLVDWTEGRICTLHGQAIGDSGYTYRDCHTGNFGIHPKTGKFMVIDTGHICFTNPVKPWNKK